MSSPALSSLVIEIAEAVVERLKAHTIKNRIVSLEDAAEYLGLTPAALRHKASLGEIPTIRFDKRFRFDRLELDNWIDSHRSQ